MSICHELQARAWADESPLDDDFDDRWKPTSSHELPDDPEFDFPAHFDWKDLEIRWFLRSMHANIERKAIKMIYEFFHDAIQAEHTI